MVAQSDLGRQVFVFQVRIGTDLRDVMSIVDPGVAFERGLCSEAIVGLVRPDANGERQLLPERFQENPAFVQFLRNLIADRVYDVEGIRQAGALQRDGYVYLIDARTADPDGEVPPADVIGAVKVRGGSLVAASYQHNPHHRLLTADGFFRLPAELEYILQTDLRARCAEVH